ncbi:MAG: GNAT family N-acetyltransferase [Lachnospiraceae bacterium]|nr:GNAT family N-acetyltransferase [Lachnospiraceae bacterium]
MGKQDIKEELLSSVKLPEGILIREFLEEDFPSIQKLCEKEGWLSYVKREEDTLRAWKNASIGLIALHEGKIVGLVRALTDGEITTYIAEILIENTYRGKGIGKALLDLCQVLYPHTRLDLLSAEKAEGFYESNNFRKMTGFRRSPYE